MTTWPRQPDSRTCGPSVLVVAEHLSGPWPDFDRQVLAMHRRVNRWWPRALGTTPWAVARELRSRGRGGRVRRFRYDEVVAALPQPVPVYLGTRWLPRHVVLVLDVQDDGLHAYDPARGAVVPIATSRWQVRWWSVLPPGTAPLRRLAMHTP
jgi:hypothetical protein